MSPMTIRRGAPLVPAPAALQPPPLDSGGFTHRFERQVSPLLQVPLP